jgi:outer membrane protein assembly factor BamD (BamD/ComL family)
MYRLGIILYQQIAKSAGREGAKHDSYSMAVQTFQRLLNEYPTSKYSQIAKNMLTELEIMSMSPEQQQAARQQQQAARMQPTIDQYKKQLAQCKGDACAAILYQLGFTYYQQTNYSMATQTYQRLSKEYPTSQYSQMAKSMLPEIEIASLPPEQQQAARIDRYKKQLAECKGDSCAAILYQLGNAYYQQAKLGGGRDYSMATQIFQQLLKEYPTSQFSYATKNTLTEIEIMSLPPEQQQATRQQRTQQTIDQYNKQLAECKGDPCAEIMYYLGLTYYQQVSSGGGRDYSMAKQTFQRLLVEYSTSRYSNMANQMLTQIEAMQKSGR